MTITRRNRLRFWKDCPVGKPDACWLWTGPVTPRWGYGVLWFNGEMDTANRAAWMVFRGPIPEGLSVLHNCPGGDNPRCCNPKHLWLGTTGDNNRDRDAKGRTRGVAIDRLGSGPYIESRPRGEGHSLSKLTDAKVREIRLLYSTGKWTLKRLAKKFDVYFTLIHMVVKCQIWKHVS